jgi:NAD(P)H dehydrogenase (quinone)
MSKPKILVTGATGKTGMPTVEELCKKGWSVRAVVHKKDARSEKLQKLGAEIFVADMYDYEQVLTAMKGIKCASFLPLVQPYMIQAANVFAVAAQEAGIEHVVQLSQWLANPAHPSLHTRQLWLSEQLLTMIPGSSFTLINPGAFADVMLQMLPTAVNMGIYPNVFGHFLNAPASNEDIGRCVAAALMAPEKHASKRYRPTGLEVLSVDDIAQIIEKVIGRRVKVQNLPQKMFLKAARVAGAGDFEITNVWHYLSDGTLGVFEVNAPTNAVLELTGKEAESFETITRRYAAMNFAQQTFSNKVKAITDFLKILITPPLNMAKHDVAMEYPMPKELKLSGNSSIWRQQHEINSGVFSLAPKL